MLASGAASPFLVRELGLHLPIYPLKGYSITVPATASAPRISITDFKRKVVYAPLRMASGEPPARATPHGELRAAGMADLAGYHATIDPVRLDQLVREARAAFPNAAANHYEAEALKPWAGLRPATPKGTPILGDIPVSTTCSSMSVTVRSDGRSRSGADAWSPIRCRDAHPRSIWRASS